MTVAGWGRGPGGADIRYARNGGVAIAYQVVGDGDVDLVYVPEWTSNLVYWWEYRRWRDFSLRLARSFRLILFDKRGTGLSDHGGRFAALETRMEDLHAVLDAAGSSSPVIFGAHEGALWPSCSRRRIRSERGRSCSSTPGRRAPPRTPTPSRRSTC